MAAANLELVTRVTPTCDWVPLFRDDAAWRTWWSGVERWFEPGCPCRWTLLGVTNELTGADGFREGWLDLLEPWEQFWGGEIEHVVDQGDRVVIVGRQSGVPVGTSDMIELLGAAIFHVRDGRISAMEFYADREEGLAAAGLGESARRRATASQSLTASPTVP